MRLVVRGLGHDIYPPYPSNIGVEGTPQPNHQVVFHTYWTDNSHLDYAVFYWNASGTMSQNGTLDWTDNPTEAWSNFTRTLPDVQVIAWYIVAYDVYGNSGNTTVQILLVGLNLTLTFYETASISASPSTWKGKAVSLAEQTQISDSSWLSISLIFRIEEAGSVTDVKYCWREVMISLSENSAFTDAEYCWREISMALDATFSISDINSFRKGMFIVVLANPKVSASHSTSLAILIVNGETIEIQSLMNEMLGRSVTLTEQAAIQEMFNQGKEKAVIIIAIPKTSASNYVTFEILVVSLEVINSETSSINATALMWKAKSFSMQELIHIMENMQSSKEIAVIAFEFTSPETVNMQDLIEMLKALGFTQQEIANAEVTQIQNKGKHIVIFEIPKQTEEMNMWKEIRISLLEIFEYIMPKTTLIPMLPAQPPEEINWGLIALCAAMLAFVLVTSVIATKRD